MPTVSNIAKLTRAPAEDIAAAALGPVLGIESSCDETAVAVLDGAGTILAERVLSQLADHAPFGGVVPEIAARAHLHHLPALVRETLAEAGLSARDLGAIAASTGPGLIGGVIVGACFGKGFALAAGKPFVAINHLEAHALTARLPGLLAEPAAFPYLALLISGGHCQFVAVEAVGRYRKLGGTIDDSIGEAFDKVGKIAGLGWPGGPAIERLATEGDPAGFAFPRPLRGRPGCDFSWSGLKTAVAQQVAKLPPGPLPRPFAANLAASFQQAVVEVMEDRTRHALAMLPEARLLVIGGGVAANRPIRAGLERVVAEHGARLAAPPARLCTDNAVMVAWAGIERLRLGIYDGLEAAPRPRWPLEELRG